MTPSEELLVYLISWVPLAGLGLLGLLLASAIFGRVRFLFRPEHEKLILRYKVPQAQAQQFREQLFTDRANHRRALERWNTLKRRSDRISADLVALGRRVDARRRRLTTQDPSVAAAVDQLFEVLVKDLATAMWIPEQWDDKLRAMAKFEQVLTANGKAPGRQARK